MFTALAASITPETVTPPSFGGQGWLFLINLWLMSAGAALMASLLKWQVFDWFKHRRIDGFRTPASLYRVIGILIASGLFVRCLAGAIELWAWNPGDRATTVWALQFKRLMDPVALTFGMTGLALFSLALPAIMFQLRREPFAIPFWPSWRALRGPLTLTVGTLAMAIGLVATR